MASLFAPVEVFGGAPGVAFRMRVLVPCWKEEQERFVAETEIRIKSALITELSEQLLAMATRGDFAGVKAAVAEVVNRQVPW